MRKMHDKCVLDYCDKEHVAKGYCSRHYKQLQTGGIRITAKGDKREPIVDGDTVRVPVGDNAKDGYCIIDKKDLLLFTGNLFLCKDYVGFWENGRTNKLHRSILGLTDPNIQVDHKNHNKLDNRRSNLRPCSQSQNKSNSPLYKNSNLGLKGITKSPSGKWIAQLRQRGKTYHLGIFLKPEEAARAYDKKAIELYGEFAHTNFKGGIYGS